MGGPWQVAKMGVRQIGLFVSWFQADEPKERSALSNTTLASVILEFLLTDRYLSGTYYSNI